MNPFNPYNHFGFLTNRVARLILLRAAPNIKAHGHDFPGSCIGVLADLWMKDGIPQKELGISLIKNKSSINKMLSCLEAEKLIVKKDDPKDRRNKLIFLTEKGRKMQTEIEELSAKMEARLLPDISQKEIAIAKKVLKTLYINLSENPFNQATDE